MSINITIIGSGNMGSALVGGLIDSQETISPIIVVDKNKELLKGYGKSVITKNKIDKEAANSNVIVLAIKPQDLTPVAKDLSDLVSSKAVILSVIAGKTTEDIGKALKHKGPIVRAMPNIAAKFRCSATVLTANSMADKSQKKLAEQIFSAVGECYWAKEDLLDAVTGLSGSGPAYIFMVIEALSDGGIKMGLPRELSLKLAAQTVLGAAVLAKETGLHPAILRDQVTTPAGTTIHAIHELETHGLRSMLIRAVETATKKSAALRKK